MLRCHLRGQKVKKKDWKISFWDKFGPKNLYCQFELKFRAYTISNMQNMVMFIISVLDLIYPFRANLVQKNQICLFTVKFGTWTNSIMHNSMLMFTFSLFDLKNLHWVNLVQNN